MAYTPAKRSTLIHLLNTGTADAPKWSLINEGVTELTESFNADTEDLQYVAEDNATTIVKRYAPSISLSAVMLEKKGTDGKPTNPDDVNAWIIDKCNTLPVGSDADTQYIRFNLLDLKNGSAFNKDGENTYTGYLRNAVVSIDSIGGAAGDTIASEVTLSGKGDATKVDVTFKKNADGTHTIRVGSSAQTSTVNFTVTSSSGTPLSNASVIFNQTAKLTDTQGKVTFSSTAGTYPYSIGKDSYVGVESNVTLSAGEEKDIDKQLSLA